MKSEMVSSITNQIFLFLFFFPGGGREEGRGGRVDQKFFFFKCYV